ncbi:DUF4114 domain-containing protein [Daejeonella sp.]|uniref:DUF4114 domain-containing protein n=1 Tax=Daejeonella sp. TaxID=2805397 RepID=UPI003983A676
MKNSKLILILLLGATYVSCKKPASTGPDVPFQQVSFKATEYKYLGSYGTLGQPLDYKLAPDTLSPILFKFIDSILPAGQDVTKANPGLLSSNSDISMSEKSDVFVTFVSEGASQLNTLAFYTYPTNNPPKKPANLQNITYMFPNASLEGWAGGALRPGDKIKIGNFDKGTSIGFVLIEKGWDSASGKVNPSGNHFCSNEVLNPETDPNLKKHTVLVKYPKENKILIGFEDMMRSEPSCDHDFNDIIIYATVKSAP